MSVKGRLLIFMQQTCFQRSGALLKDTLLDRLHRESEINNTFEYRISDLLQTLSKMSQVNQAFGSIHASKNVSRWLLKSYC